MNSRDWSYEEVEDSLIEHIEDSRDHKGFDPFGQGGCSCGLCCVIRGAIRDMFKYERTCRENGIIPPSEMVE